MTGGSPAPVEALGGLLELFDQAPLVALDEAHWVEQQHALLQQLLLDERFTAAFDDIVVGVRKRPPSAAARSISRRRGRSEARAAARLA